MAEYITAKQREERMFAKVRAFLGKSSREITSDDRRMFASFVANRHGKLNISVLPHSSEPFLLTAVRSVVTTENLSALEKIMQAGASVREISSDPVFRPFPRLYAFLDYCEGKRIQSQRTKPVLQKGVRILSAPKPVDPEMGELRSAALAEIRLRKKQRALAMQVQQSSGSSLAAGARV